jgi:hypothetical protein
VIATGSLLAVAARHYGHHGGGGGGLLTTLLHAAVASLAWHVVGRIVGSLPMPVVLLLGAALAALVLLHLLRSRKRARAGVDT